MASLTPQMTFPEWTIRELPFRRNRSLLGTEHRCTCAGSNRSGRRCGIFVVVTSTQEAFARAKQYATELLGEWEYTLEEVEQDVYKNRRVWRITLGFPKRRISAPELIRSIAASLPLEYKTVLVDIETGKPVAMKLAS